MWLVHAGDDPAFASPGFDDSGWTPFNPSHDLTSLYGKSKPEIIWYRLRLKTDPGQKNLAVSEFQISRAIEIYANGRRILASGQLKPFVPYTMGAHQVADIPDTEVATGSVVLAMRVHIASPDWRAENAWVLHLELDHRRC